MHQCLLCRVQRAARGQALDGRDRPAVDLGHRRLAREHRRPVDQHRAGAAHPFAATELRVGEPERAADPAEQRAACAVEHVTVVVHDHDCHACHPKGSPRV